MIKNKHLAYAAICISLFTACDRKSDTSCNASYEFYPPNLRDTVNFTDCKGRKQGKWVPSRLNKLKEIVFYRNDTIISQGIRENNHFADQSIVRDTINRTDAKGERQGKWMEKNEKGFVESGSYINNKREGIWEIVYTDYKLTQRTFTVQYKNDSLQKVN